MTDATMTAIGASGARRERTLASLLTAGVRDEARAEANRWIKRLRLVRYDGRSMRQRFRYQNDSLWWFTEVYLHKTRRLERAVETLFALETLCAMDAPHQLAVRACDPAVRTAATAFGHARNLAVMIDDDSRQAPAQDDVTGLLIGPAALLSRVRNRTRPSPAHPPRVAAFLHTAFWKTGKEPNGAGRESYIGAVLEALAARVPPEDVALVGLGPRRNFRTRRWWDPLLGRAPVPRVTPIERLAPARALAGSIDIWRHRDALAHDLTSGADIRAAGSWRGYDLWPLLSDELQRAARVQWPWSARSMDEARAALARLRPELVLTYAEAGGWGRALLLEARRAGVPSVGLQHGFIYRHWLNYEHELDEMQPDDDDEGFPHPDRTLVFDGYAADTLVSRGHYPAPSIVVTGSPRLDELASRASTTPTEREARRTGLGITPSQRLLVLAAKFIEIEAELPSIVAAVAEREDLRLIIKPHPAETAAIYRRSVEGHAGVTVADETADLGHLLAVADGIITMNSTVAVDGLTLGVPALVVGIPSNLSPFVDAGVMVGATSGTIRAGIEALLYDQQARTRLGERAAAFVRKHRMQSDGQAASRAADQILMVGLARPDA